MGDISQKCLRRRPNLQFPLGSLKSTTFGGFPKSKETTHILGPAFTLTRQHCHSGNLFNHYGPTCGPSSFLKTTTGSAFIFKQLVDAIKRHRAGEFIDTWQAHVVRRLDTRSVSTVGVGGMCGIRWKMTSPVCLKHKRGLRNC